MSFIEVAERVRREGEAKAKAANDRAKAQEERQINSAWDQSQEARERQVAFMRELADRYKGRSQQPSVSEAALRNGMNQAQNQQLALARSGNGTAMQNAARFSQAQQIGGQMQQDVAARAAMMRAREADRARAMQAQMLSGQRSQDLSGTQAWQGYELGRRGQNLAQARFNAQQDQQNTDRWMNAGAAVLGAGATLLSDERSKDVEREVRPDRMRSFLRSLKGTSHVWQYKDEAPVSTDDRGDHVGPMTQELDESDVGKMLVRHGKGRDYDQIDIKRALGAILSGMGELQSQIDEGKR